MIKFKVIKLLKLMYHLESLCLHFQVMFATQLISREEINLKEAGK